MKIIGVPESDPNGTVRVRLEIAGEFPDGVPHHVRRAVSENATQLGFEVKVFEAREGARADGVG